MARYADSIESLVRNNIQKMKIDMANEVIDAGRFDMKTTMGERRQTLEDMLQVREPPALYRCARSHPHQSCDVLRTHGFFDMPSSTRQKHS